MALMHGKCENFLANICNILPRPAVSNRLIVVKLKWDLKYRNHAYFEIVHLSSIPSMCLFKIA